MVFTTVLGQYHFQKENVKKVLTTLFFILCSAGTFSAYGSDKCDQSMIKRSSFYRFDSKMINPQHFEERILSLSEACEFLTEINKLYSFDNLSNKKIQFILNWDYSKKNASASFDTKEEQFTITFDGGLLNMTNFSKGALATIACHEVGHIIGGTPQTRGLLRKDFEEMNLSEGMSDYFATHKCLKKLYRNGILNEESSPKIARIDTICSTSLDYLECITVLNSSYDNFNSSNFNGENLNIPSGFIAEGNHLSGASMVGAYYPPHSCRFDVAISGYFCSESSDSVCGVDTLGNAIFSEREIKSSPPKCLLKY